MRSMGYVDFNVSMESKRVNASPLPGRSLSTLRGQMSLNGSPFCPGSSSKLTQSIIQDHMVSHYKKVYSAKAAIDASVPKSMIHSVKYNDQIRREQLRKGGRPQSAHTLSQRNSRASCSSAEGRRSVQGEESPYFCVENAMTSSPRLNTSFHAKQIAYPSYTTGGSQSHSHPIRPVSELSYRSPEANPHRQHSARSYSASGTQSGYKTFQDPAQKTYSGDLLQKHSHYFTQHKHFTPRTLKSDKSSYLSEYRYYTAPRRKPDQDHTNPRLMRQETYHGRTQTKEYSSTEFDNPPQGFSTEHEWSDDESNSLNISLSRQQSKKNKSRARGSDFFHSSSRVSPEGMKSPIMMRVSTEEEELMYLEFIADVTNEILSRGLFSDRVLDRVFKRHIDMNKHRLNEDKMRHLLEVLRKDLEGPVNTSACSAELKITKNDLLHTHMLSQDLEVPVQLETKENNDLLPYASFIKDYDSQESTVPLSVSTPLHCSSPEMPASTEACKEDLEDLLQKRSVGSPRLSESASECTMINVEDLRQNKEDVPVTNDYQDLHQNHDYTTMTSDEDIHLNPAEDNHDGLSKELEDLGKSLSESLFVSDGAHPENQETTDAQHINTFVSLSDDEF